MKYVIITLMMIFSFGAIAMQSDTVRVETEQREEENEDQYDESEDEDEDEDDKPRKRTRSYWNFDLGMNNYLENNKFPDADNQVYTVKPWGSWYVGIASVQKTKLFGPVYMEWGGSISWYNFKFQDPSVTVVKGADMAEFIKDVNPDINFIKSKLTVSYVNAFLVPVLHFDGNGGGIDKYHDNDEGFRIGVGPYIGYRVGSKTKSVFNDGRKQKDKVKDNFYLSNVRYGVRAQVGWKGTDVFFNYDMNTLFEEGRAPELTPFSFGIIF